MNPFILVIVMILGIHVGLNLGNILNKDPVNYQNSTETKGIDNE